MRVVIGYESMYGQTRRVARAIATGFSPDDDVAVVPVSRCDGDATTADLLIIGAPTHAHGLPGAKSRQAAIDGAPTRYDSHTLGSLAAGSGVREWPQQLPAGVK